ncbi:hypothetical protein BCV71DRAFT_234081 [Rhizopus microsporus]|uniref:Uncharacterized protein n=1 Tax=Rhizopus microsporus TaxID=58291 RepID=A0A1X0S5F3_RHIZD|nr:hypothetical protein BCV71DRAFT_234081 [Rhizopus microsporus]
MNKINPNIKKDSYSACLAGSSLHSCFVSRLTIPVWIITEGTTNGSTLMLYLFSCQEGYPYLQENKINPNIKEQIKRMSSLNHYLMCLSNQNGLAFMACLFMHLVLPCVSLQHQAMHSLTLHHGSQLVEKHSCKSLRTLCRAASSSSFSFEFKGHLACLYVQL